MYVRSYLVLARGCVRDHTVAWLTLGTIGVQDHFSRSSLSGVSSRYAVIYGLMNTIVCIISECRQLTIAKL
jgi:hypothetical protein